MWIKKEKYYSDLKEAKLQGIHISYNEILYNHYCLLEKEYDFIMDNKEFNIDNKIKGLRLLSKHLLDVDTVYRLRDNERLSNLGFDWSELPFTNFKSTNNDIGSLRDKVSESIAENLYVIDRNRNTVKCGDLIRLQVSEHETEYQRVYHDIQKGLVVKLFNINTIGGYSYFSLKGLHRDQWEKVDHIPKPKPKVYKLPPIEEENKYNE